MKKILILAAISLVGVIASAQTVGPVYVESKLGKKPFKGQFLVQNPTVLPLSVVVEPKQLQVTDGKPVFGSLRPGTTVTLKDTSAVVPPRSSRTFDYEVQCQGQETCMVMILSGLMTSNKTKEGMLVRLWLPSSFYGCTDTARDCRVRIKKVAGLE